MLGNKKIFLKKPNHFKIALSYIKVTKSLYVNFGLNTNSIFN